VGRRAWNQIAPLVGGVALALVIRALVLETFYVPSESMLSTLLVGDHVFVNKFVYGARIPGTDIRLPALREPRRGDVIVFDLGRKGGDICPLDRCPDYPGDAFIKRLIGLPGDSVEVSSRGVWLNDEKLESRDSGTTFQNERGFEMRVLEEELPSALGVCRHVALDHPLAPGQHLARVEVPPGHFLAMGDNRDESNDSRGWGFVPMEDVRGPAFLIYWSWNNRESWLAMLNPWTWIKLLWSETRWERFGGSLSCVSD